MSKDVESKSPRGNQPSSPKPRQNERSPSQPKTVEEDDAAWTEDDDSDQSENDQTDRSRFSNSPETSSRSSIKSSETYKSTGNEHGKELRTVQRKETLGEESKKNTSNESSIWPTKNHYIRNCFWCLLLPIMIGVWITLNHGTESAAVVPLQEDRFKIFVNDLTAIKNKFPDQTKRSWLDIRGGVLDVMHSSGKPWTIVLFSNETTTISCLAELLGAVTSKALKSNSSLVLKPKDMGNEYGDAIHRLRPLISERKAVVVHDLLNIDPGAIQAFHSMCDRESPLVKEAVYIITIITPGYTSSQRPETFVENILTERFVNRVDLDNLQPLITRLTDGPIIPVAPANVPAKCTM